MFENKIKITAPFWQQYNIRIKARAIRHQIR